MRSAFLALVGAVLLLAGLYLIYVPLAFLGGGAALILAAVNLEERTDG